MQQVDPHQQVLQLLGQNELQQADSLLEQILEHSPADAGAWVQRGFVANRRGDYDRAIGYLRTALKYNPRSADIHCQLGQVYRNRGHLDHAIDSFREAIGIMPENIQAYQLLTDMLLASYRHQDLIAICRDAIASLPDNVDLHCKLAIGLEQGHRLEEARAEVSEVLRLAPGHPRAVLTLAKIEKRSGNLKKARDILLELGHAGLEPLQRSAVLVELGNVLDLLGEYSAAFGAYQESNEAVRRMLGPVFRDAATVLDTIDHYQSVLTGEFMRNWADEEPDDGVSSPIFLVGFPRSGTTLTEQIITASGGIEPSDEEAILPRLLGEIPEVIGRPFVYPDQLNSLTEREITALRRHYWMLAGEMIGTGIGNRRLLDKLPLNLGEIGLIYRLFPSAPLVVLLRDPRDCCLSCFMRSFAPSKPMNNFLTLEGTARFYARLMGFWLHMRGSIGLRYLEVRYEDLVEDLEGTARPLIEHIGAKWSDSVLEYFRHNRTRAVRTPSYSDVSRPIFRHAAGRWRHYAEKLEPVIPELQPFIDEFGYRE